jgi:hypothetical protein
LKARHYGLVNQAHVVGKRLVLLAQSAHLRHQIVARRVFGGEEGGIRVVIPGAD